MRRAAATIGLAGGAYVVSDVNRREAFAGMVDGYTRAAVTIGNTAIAVVDYRRHLAGRSREEPGYMDDRAAFDQRTADRILKVCLQHGGCYTKLGQHIAGMNHVLPREYTTTLSVLQNKARPKPFAQVSRTIERELGRPWEEIFEHMEPEPLAAASLAQVHRGRLRGGREVVVKVQYPHLKRQIEYDLMVLEHLLTLLEFFFPEFSIGWLLPEARAALFRELDFWEEGKNADRLRGLMRQWVDSGALHIPEIEWPLTDKQVLTMEYVPVQVKVNDAERVRELGVEPGAVGRRLAQIFGEMVFGHGFVHTDPHPGNVFVRSPEGSPGGFQIVLLDHGAYFALSEHFRMNYALLWKAMLLRDNAGIQRAGEELGAGEMAQFFPLMFTYRPIFSKNRLGLKGATSDEDRKRLREQLTRYTPRDWNTFAESLPRDMLYAMRVNDLVRAANKDLGGTTRDRLKIMGDCAVRGLARSRAVAAAAEGRRAERPPARAPLWAWFVPSSVAAWVESARLRTQLWLIDLVLLALETVEGRAPASGPPLIPDPQPEKPAPGQQGPSLRIG